MTQYIKNEIILAQIATALAIKSRFYVDIDYKGAGLSFIKGEHIECYFDIVQVLYDQDKLTIVFHDKKESIKRENDWSNEVQIIHAIGEMVDLEVIHDYKDCK